ncbi:hypothetical protein CANINC_002944 [Pichia inconspicua]|uniref:DUF3835 domain-containing protein n=1 Tax=Pichia inconspicua TaxID=52247 RepID=A0A4T0X006_9ASCO|nr:hypothetical protein CANINC_002944 [[Candida] inconspicua]
MDKELKIIDGIVNNLAGIQSFYEFEYEHLSTLLKLLRNFQEETSSSEELSSNCEMFNKDTSMEIEELEKRLQYASKRVDQLKGEIQTRLESKGKLLQLFESLKSVEVMESKGKVEEEELPVMEICEELDDEDKVIKSEVKPYKSKENELRELMAEVERRKGAEVKDDNDDGVVVQNSFRFLSKKEDLKDEKFKDVEEVLEDDGEFRPFVIREEIDEDGNTVKSSMSRIPQMENNQKEEEGDIDEDQITELLEDMGLKEGEEETEKIEEDIQTKFNVATDDLYTLELLADEINDGQDDDGEEGDGGDMIIDNIDEYEWPVIDEEDDDDDDEIDDEVVQDQTLEKMFGTHGKSLFAQQIMELRGQSGGKSGSNTDKKSVTFNEKVEVKEVPDIWDDVRASERESIKVDAEKEVEKKSEKKVSLFKRSIGRDKPVQSNDLNRIDVAVGDVVERQVVEVERPVLKTNLKSLQRDKASGVKIEMPQEWNPLTHQGIEDEDFEIVRREAEVEDVVRVESDEEEGEGEREGDEDGIPVTNIDYANLGEDLETMAKAYVMGLYDEGESIVGPIIEEIDDFAKHNAVVGETSETITEVEEEETDRPMVTDIVEQDIDTVLAQNSVVNEIDVALHDETLATEVALAYAARRREALRQGFDSEEGEFVPRDDAPRVSRFKAARKFKGLA